MRMSIYTHTMCSQSCFFGIGYPWARNVIMVFLLGHGPCLEFGVTLGFSMGHGFMEQMAIFWLTVIIEWAMGHGFQFANCSTGFVLGIIPCRDFVTLVSKSPSIMGYPAICHPTYKWLKKLCLLTYKSWDDPPSKPYMVKTCVQTC